MSYNIVTPLTYDLISMSACPFVRRLGESYGSSYEKRMEGILGGWALVFVVAKGKWTGGT